MYLFPPESSHHPFHVKRAESITDEGAVSPLSWSFVQLPSEARACKRASTSGSQSPLFLAASTWHGTGSEVNKDTERLGQRPNNGVIALCSHIDRAEDLSGPAARTKPLQRHARATIF
jgi:hypothetical protein